MAHKDYVARGRAPKKPTKKKQQAPERPPLPWLRIVITIGLIGAFAWGLWQIKGSAPESEQPVVTTAPQTENNEDDLPELPEEEWEFIKTLPGYEVEVDVEEQAKSDKRYLMQCGSFRSESQAQEMRAKAAFQGLEAQVRPSNGKNGLWYRVIFGPYDTKRAAEKDKHSLRRVDITTCQIWYWNL